MRRELAIAVIALVAFGAGMLTSRTWKRRSLERALEAETTDDRVIDMGIVIHVVVADPNGLELLDGRPTVRVVRSHRFGGLVDTRMSPATIVASSRRPVIWLASEDQEEILLHGDAKKTGQLVYGSEGAGKSTVLAMWHALQVIRHIGEHREGGQTAPTEKRLEVVRREMERLYRADWFRYRTAQKRLEFCDGSRVQLVSTHRQSQEAGSPIQGFNWSWAGADEAQDQVESHEDIESRGRSARAGVYPQLRTATAKDDSDWRTLRDRLDASGHWVRRTMLATRSPFFPPLRIEAARQTMSPREFQRRVLAMDVGPERMQYPTWDREKNLIAIPDIGWTDVTERELRGMGGNYAGLGGHDPGTLFDVTLVLKAFIVRPQQLKPWWVVVDEITTEQTTMEQHVVTALARIRDRWNLNKLRPDGKGPSEGPRILVRADPYGNNDSRPDRACYTVWRNAGVTIHPAAYNPTGEKPGRVPKEAGIDLVCSLFCNAAGERRLFVARDAQGRPVAPRLVKTLEASERDTDGKAETQRKDVQDLSHWGAALRYALWAIERPRLQLAPAAPVST